MASADKPSLIARLRAGGEEKVQAFDFLPDADEIERRPLPAVARVTLHVLLTAFVGFLVWASFSEVDMIVTARGKLVTPLSNLVVQPLETSIIQSIEVRVGQVVKKGQRLATLDATFAEADESQLRNRLDSLNTQLANIEAELSGGGPILTDNPSADDQIQSQLSQERRATFAAQQRRQQESIAKLQSERATAQRDEQGTAARVKVLREMATMAEDLVSKKLAPRSRLLEAQDRLLEAQRTLELSRNRQVEISRELAALHAEKSSFETGWRQRLLEEQLSVSRERDAVADQLQKASRRQSMVVLTAPADAVVLEIANLSTGSIVREAEPFFTLVPLGEVLEADVQIDSQDIGYVKTGDVTHIKLDAFPFQKHGMLKGTLRTISQDAFKRNGNAGTLDAYYAGRIAVSDFKLENVVSGVSVLPGMTLAAEIHVGKRSVISYLLWPVTKAFNESIREP